MLERIFTCCLPAFLQWGHGVKLLIQLWIIWLSRELIVIFQNSRWLYVHLFSFYFFLFPVSGDNRFSKWKSMWVQSSFKWIWFLFHFNLLCLEVVMGLLKPWTAPNRTVINGPVNRWPWFWSGPVNQSCRIRARYAGQGVPNQKCEPVNRWF